jgi:hypothetical protein
MLRLSIALALAATACSPPPASERAETAPVETTAEAPDYGPYVNNWESNEVSRFTHTLHAPTPGDHVISLAAQTNSPGGQTVALYPLGPNGEALDPRIMFVIADYDGGSETGSLNFPASGAGVPVMVVVEGAGDRTWAGSYTLSVGP